MIPPTFLYTNHNESGQCESKGNSNSAVFNAHLKVQNFKTPYADSCMSYMMETASGMYAHFAVWKILLL